MQKDKKKKGNGAMGSVAANNGYNKYCTKCDSIFCGA